MTDPAHFIVARQKSSPQTMCHLTATIISLSGLLWLPEKAALWWRQIPTARVPRR